MVVVQTSMLAYVGITPTIQEREQQVLEALRQLGTASNMELAQHLRWSVNRVTGRTFLLRQKGIVIDAGISECSITKQSVHKWTIQKTWMV
jgi:hypothetical protein